MKTWERREQIRDRNDVVVNIGVSRSFPYDGVRLGAEITWRLAQGWELIAQDTESFVLKSPIEPNGRTVWASYFVQGFD